jgi:hypothetical protein
MSIIQEPAPLSPSQGGDRLASKILTSSRIKREVFDPNNIEHLKSYRTFLLTANWGEVQFYYEHPWVTVPETVMRKFALHTLGEILGGPEKATLSDGEPS